MKKVPLMLTALLTLGACASGTAKYNRVDASVWEMAPMDMCQTLIEQNRSALDAVRAKYGEAVAAKAAPLYQDLDLRTNAVCRSRMARRSQNERIQALRAEYQRMIDEAISCAK